MALSLAVIRRARGDRAIIGLFRMPIKASLTFLVLFMSPLSSLLDCGLACDNFLNSVKDRRPVFKDCEWDFLLNAVRD